MQRDILFRGKNAYNGEWIESKGLMIHSDGIVIMILSENENGFTTTPVIPETVCQFTGRYIKGQRLFDGDIFKTSSFLKQVKFIPERMGFAIANVDDLNNPHTVSVLGDSLWQIPSSQWWDEFHSVMEIIGNIHDNGSK